MVTSPLKKLRIINVLIIALIFLSVLLLSRDIVRIGYSKKISKKTEIPYTTKPELRKIKGIMSYAPILEQNPFGNPGKLIPIATKHNAPKDGSLAELILVGTVVGPEKLSYAIFEDQSRSNSLRQEIFAYRENVFGYGILTKIEREWVEVTEGANTSKIHIIEPPIQVLGEEQTASSHTSFVKKISDKQYLLDQRSVQQALNNPEQILTDARLLPNIINGRQEGFRISEVKKGGLYHSLGLRNNDILLRVNNLEISQPEVAIQAMTALRGMNTVNLDIMRNNAKITMTYQIR